MSKNTEWAESAKGNQWRRYNGQNIVVGMKKNGKYWALHFDGIRENGTFAKGEFSTLEDAMTAAEKMAGEQE